MKILTFRLSMFGDYNKYSATTAMVKWMRLNDIEHILLSTMQVN